MTRRHVFKKVGATLAAFAVLLGSTTVPAFAATPATSTGGSGMRVSPVRTNLVLKPGQNNTVDVYVTNVTSQEATFQVVMNDFIASGDESGNPALILDDTKSEPKHGLKQYTSPLPNVTLKAGEQKDIKVALAIPANATPGGYYGAVRFVPATSASGKNVSLTASVASLILVKVPGTIKEQMSIESLDVLSGGKSHSIFTSNKDLSVNVRFRNSGDVQEQPFGKLTVKGTGGKAVYSTEVNNSEAPGQVLPDSVRKFSVPIKKVGSFGRYTVFGDFGYGSGQELTGSTTFYVVPAWAMIAIVALIVLILVAIVEVPRLIRRYNRSVIRKASRS